MSGNGLTLAALGDIWQVLSSARVLALLFAAHSTRSEDTVLAAYGSDGTILHLSKWGENPEEQ